MEIGTGNCNFITILKLKLIWTTSSMFFFLLLSSVVDPDPHGSGFFAWTQQNMKEQINKNVISL